MMEYADDDNEICLGIFKFHLLSKRVDVPLALQETFSPGLI